jgi:predicted RNA-binding Zn-ribbon protein involved in translation (DUF1610 family)
MRNVYYCSKCGFRTFNETGLKRSTGCCGNSGFYCPKCPSVVMRVVGTTKGDSGITIVKKSKEK